MACQFFRRYKAITPVGDRNTLCFFKGPNLESRVLEISTVKVG